MSGYDDEQPVRCAICREPPQPGRRRWLTISRRFFGCGVVPLWAIVHKGCDWRESRKAYIERRRRELQPDGAAGR
jgi:hypothetical protein